MDEVKRYLNIDAADTTEDTKIDEFIVEARRLAERITGRKFITQTLIGYADAFHGHQDEEFWAGRRIGKMSDISGTSQAFLQLDHAPAQSISSIVIIDGDNNETTYSSDNYYLDNYDNSMFPRVYLKDSASPPVDLRYRNGVKVTWVAGYGASGSSVPSDIKSAIKKMTGHIFYNRGDCDDCAEKSGALSHLEEFIIKTL